MIPPSQLIRVVLVAGSAVSCEAVLGAPDYHIVAGQTTLAALYAADSPTAERCAVCLVEGACGDAFRQCDEFPGCREFAACTLETPSPASDLECVVRLNPPEYVRSTTATLARCYARCVGACDAGADFRCAGQYSYSTTPPEDEVLISHTLRFSQAANISAAGLRVSICRPGITCEDPITSVTTDETGTYVAEVPINRDSPISEAGFFGFRVVHGQPGLLFPHRLQSTRRTVVDQFEQTGLLYEPDVRDSFPLFNLAEGALNAFLVQMLDCRFVGAGGIFFEVDSPGARIEYLLAPDRRGPGPTVASMEGMALVLDLELDRFHQVRALTTDGQLVGVDDVYVDGDSNVLSVLVPMEVE